MDQRGEYVVTPEAVAIGLDVAGLGSRMIALLLDTLIQAAAALVLGFAAVFAGLDQTAVQVVLGILLFVLVWGYFPLWETLWAGRTPGKRAQHLRVVRTDGQPAGVAPILVRNLIRIVDFLPVNYAIGAVTMLVSRRSQRLGDLAAGTIVVRDRPAPQPAQLRLTSPAASVDTAGLSQRDYVLVRDFLQRRGTLAPEARAALAAKIAGALRRRVPGALPGGGVPGGGFPGGDEAFLESIAASFRSRFGRDPGA